MSIYIDENIVHLNDKQYEKLFSHPENMTYRVILSDDDYDYVEDDSLIQELDKLFKAKMIQSLKRLETDSIVTCNMSDDEIDDFVEDYNSMSIEELYELYQL